MNARGGLSFDGPLALRMKRTLAFVMRENARRRACPYCGLLILPERQAAHAAAVHAEDGA